MNLPKVKSSKKVESENKEKALQIIEKPVKQKIKTVPIYVHIPESTLRKFYDLQYLRAWKTNAQAIATLIEEEHEKKFGPNLRTESKV